VLLSGKPEPFIVTTDAPELPDNTPALKESLEFPRVTEEFIKAASAFWEKTITKKTLIKVAMTNLRITLNYSSLRILRGFRS